MAKNENVVKKLKNSIIILSVVLGSVIIALSVMLTVFILIVLLIQARELNKKLLILQNFLKNMLAISIFL